jgi:hypothetical protein
VGGGERHQDEDRHGGCSSRRSHCL